MKSELACLLTFITMIPIDCKITNVTEFWKINHFVGHETIRIFKLSMALS